MANGGRASKGHRTRNLHVPYAAGARRRPAKSTIAARRSDSPHANSSRRTRKKRIRFRFVLVTIVNAHESCGWLGALPVDGLGGGLRGFRKSHPLIPASRDPNKCRAIRGLQPAVVSARAGLPY